MFGNCLIWGEKSVLFLIVNGQFSLRYQSDENSKWQPIDLIAEYRPTFKWSRREKAMAFFVKAVDC